MDAELKTKWVEALRGGLYQQTQGTLHDLHTGGRCCLGVLVEVAGIDMDLAKANYDPIPLDRNTQGILQVMNDIKGKSFRDIADYIEANL